MEVMPTSIDRPTDGRKSKQSTKSSSCGALSFPPLSARATELEFGSLSRECLEITFKE